MGRMGLKKNIEFIADYDNNVLFPDLLSNIFKKCHISGFRRRMLRFSF